MYASVSIVGTVSVYKYIPYLCDRAYYNACTAATTGDSSSSQESYTPVYNITIVIRIIMHARAYDFITSLKDFEYISSGIYIYICIFTASTY
jgi:hypothetical protein